MPKVELHVHHLGATPLPVLAELAARHPKVGLPEDSTLLAERLAVRDVDTFFAAYRSVVELVRTPQDVHDTLVAVGLSLAEVNVKYAEVTCSPFSSVSRGVPLQAFSEAMTAAREVVLGRHGVELAWIVDIPRPDAEAARVTLDVVLHHAPEGLVAMGIGGVEVAPRQFVPYFNQARAHGLRLVPHTGETRGPESVWEAVRELRPDRLGHATSAVADRGLLAHLARTGLPVEVCLTSNLRLRGYYKDRGSHTVRAMREAGVVISVNTDDPVLFGCNLNEEYLRVAAILDLGEAGVLDLAQAAVRSSFAPDPTRTALLRALAGHAEQAKQWRPAL